MENPNLTVNGQRRQLGLVPAHTTTLDWLRNNGLTGSKEGCAEGECGACAILVAQPDNDGGTTWVSVNSCLVPIAALDGQEVVTSEGLGSAEHLHPVQRGLALAGGSQCGYCTPGFACSMASEFYRGDRSDDATGEVHDEHGPNGFDLHALSGNLCRCTGYRPIRDAAYALGVPDADDALAARRGRPRSRSGRNRPSGRRRPFRASGRRSAMHSDYSPKTPPLCWCRVPPTGASK